MKSKYLLAAIASLAVLLSAVSAKAEAPLAIETIPPVVIKTVPEAGATDVDFGAAEIRIMYSKPMQASASFTLMNCKDGSLIKTPSPRLEADGKTFVVKIKLEPGTTYFYFANNQKFKSFKDTNGNSALPYQVVFTTKAKRTG